MGIYGDLLKLNEEKNAKTPRKEEAGVSSPELAQPISPSKTKTPKPSDDDTTTPRHRGIKQPHNHATVVSRYQGATVEVIRAAVKLFGKEAATHRFTAEEKKALADLVYTYRRQGTRTSENEITRIGVNFIVVDYEENGENSILHRVLEALNS